MAFDVQYIAKLARLRISGDEEQQIGEQMAAIIKMVEHLPELGEEFCLLEADNLMQLREDEVRPSYLREEILQNAPEVFEGRFVVPQGEK